MAMAPKIFKVTVDKQPNRKESIIVPGDSEEEVRSRIRIKWVNPPGPKVKTSAQVIKPPPNKR